MKAKKKHRRKVKKRSTNGILSETDEKDFFNNKESDGRPRARAKKSAQTEEVNLASSCMPPPPFSSQVPAANTDDVTEVGHHIKRLPVKVLGSVGSLADEMPRSSKGLPEVAIAGRSNVGKSTLLNVSDPLCTLQVTSILYLVDLYVSLASITHQGITIR